MAMEPTECKNKRGLAFDFKSADDLDALALGMSWWQVVIAYGAELRGVRRFLYKYPVAIRHSPLTLLLTFRVVAVGRFASLSYCVLTVFLCAQFSSCYSSGTAMVAFDPVHGVAEMRVIGCLCIELAGRFNNGVP